MVTFFRGKDSPFGTIQKVERKIRGTSVSVIKNGGIIGTDFLIENKLKIVLDALRDGQQYSVDISCYKTRPTRHRRRCVLRRSGSSPYRRCSVSGSRPIYVSPRLESAVSPGAGKTKKSV